MAKIQGPCHSDDATGKLGKTQIVRNKQGLIYSSAFYFPGSKKKFTKSSAQTEQRALYKKKATEWSALTEAEKLVYINRAKNKKYTGYNLYMQESMAQFDFAVLGELVLGIAILANEP